MTTGNFPPDLGGPAVFLEELCRALHENGHEVHVIAYGTASNHRRAAECDMVRRGRNATAASDNVSGHSFPFRVSRISRSLPAPLRLALYTQKTVEAAAGKDVIMGCDYSPPAFIASLLTGIPLILRQVSDPAWEWAYRTGRTQGGPTDFHQKRDSASTARHLIHLAGMLWAKRIMTPGKYMKRLIQSWGIRPNRIVVIPNAASPPEKIPNLPSNLPEAERRKERIKRRQELDVNSFCILYAGRIVPLKRLDLVIETFRKVQERHPETTLVIVGENPEGNDLSAMPFDVDNTNSAKPPSEHVRSNNRYPHRHGQIVYTGRLERHDLFKWYQAADVLLLLSEYEGMSHVLLEAQASGLAAVVSDRCGNPEVVVHDKTGFIVPFGDTGAAANAVLKLVEDPDLQHSFSQAALKRSKLFDPKKRIAKYMDAIVKTARH